MFLDLSECSSVRRPRCCQPEKCSWTYPSTTSVLRHTACPKNVHGPIRSSLDSLGTRCITRKMFLDLSAILPAPDCVLSTRIVSSKPLMMFRQTVGSARSCALTLQARPLRWPLEVWGCCRSSRLIPRHLSLPTLTPAFEDSRIPAIPQRESSSVAVPLRSGRSSCESRSRESAPPDRGATHDRDRGPLDAQR